MTETRYRVDTRSQSEYISKPDLLDLVTDANNNQKETSSAFSFTSPTEEIPHIILDRGPSYLRDRIFNRVSAFERPSGHLCAAEALKQTRPLYVQHFQPTSRTTEPNANDVLMADHTPPGPPAGSRLGATDGSAFRLPGSGAKRRFSSRSDDQYGGQKQRQKLGGKAIFIRDGTGSCEDDEDSPDYQNEKKKEERADERQQNTEWCSPNLKRTDEETFKSPMTINVEHYDTLRSKVVVGDISGNSNPETGFSESYVCSSLAQEVESMDIQSDNPTKPGLGQNPDAESMDISVDAAIVNHETIPGFAGRGKVIPNVGAGGLKSMESNLISPRFEEPKCIRIPRRYRKSSTSRQDFNRLSGNSEHAEIPPRSAGLELDSFFGEMVSDRAAAQRDITTRSATSLNILENISSIGTPLDSRSRATTTSDESQIADDTLLKSLNLEERESSSGGVGMSVIERNARIIKWLCSIKKVSGGATDDEI